MEDEKDKSPERREFLKTAGVAALGAGLMPTLLSAQEGVGVKLTRPITPRLLSSKTTQEGSAEVVSMEVELLGANGAKHLMTAYNKKVESDTDYSMFTVLKTDAFKTAEDVKPSESSMRVVSTYAVKGEATGTTRKDTVTTTHIGPEGISVSGPTKIDKSLTDMFKGMAAEDLVSAILKPKLQ